MSVFKKKRRAPIPPPPPAAIADRVPHPAQTSTVTPQSAPSAPVQSAPSAATVSPVSASPTSALSAPDVSPVRPQPWGMGDSSSIPTPPRHAAEEDPAEDDAVGSGAVVEGSAVSPVTATPVAQEKRAQKKRQGRGSRPRRARRPRRTLLQRLFGSPRPAGQRTRKILRRLGWDRLETKTIFTSSAQAQCLSPALLATNPLITGPPAGRDEQTRQPVTISPHEMYAHHLIGSPNVAVLGGINMGKSSFVKNQYVLRPYALGYSIAVFDRKVQRDDGVTSEGEYLKIARLVNAAILHFNRGPGGATLNPLDPLLAVSTSDKQVGQDELLLLLAETANGGPLVDTADHAPRYALSRAHKAALARAEEEGRAPVLQDVINALYTPDSSAVPGPRGDDGNPVLTDAGVVTQSTLMRWGLGVALNLERYTSGDWSGLFDGVTSGPNGEPLSIGHRFLVIDTSAIPEGSQLLGLVMSIMSTYIMSHWARTQGKKILVLEEAYNSENLDRVPGLLRALAKRGRGLGAGLVTVMHHLSDLKPGGEMYSLIRECELVHIFRQDKADDASQAISLFNLPTWSAEPLMTLDQGVHLLIRGQLLRPTWLRHLRTDLEAEMNDTEAAMRSENELDEAAPFEETKGDTHAAV